MNVKHFTIASSLAKKPASKFRTLPTVTLKKKYEKEKRTGQIMHSTFNKITNHETTIKKQEFPLFLVSK